LFARYHPPPPPTEPYREATTNLAGIVDGPCSIAKRAAR
jgi:hypothetical protein